MVGFISHLRIGNEDDLDQESDQEKDLPEVEYTAILGILDDHVAFTPVSLCFGFLRILREGIFIVILLEKEFHEVFVAIPKLEIWLHIRLI